MKKEQRQALEQAGFTDIHLLLDEGGMALYCAINDDIGAA